MSFIRERLITFIISSGIVLILLSPLPFGNVETWSVSLFEIIAFLTFGVWLTGKIIKRRIRLPQSPLYIPMGLLFLLVIFQTIQLPDSILNILSPHSFTLWQSKREALVHIFGGQINLAETISLYPFVTWQKLLLYLSYAVFFLVTTDHIRTSKQIKRFFWIIFTVAMIESLIGLLQYIASGTKVSASGSYINPNHFAGLLLLVTPLFLGYLIYISAKEHIQTNSWKQLIKSLSSNNILLLFATSLIAISLILSQSRGAIFSFAAAMLFLYLLISLNKKSSTVKWLLGVFFVLIILYSFWIGLDPVIEKFSETEEALPLRTYIWKDTFNLIKDFPAFGTGLGTFSLAYTLYKEDAYWPYVYDHAHNDYMELAAETGLIGFFLVLFAFVSFYKRAVYNIRKFSPQKDPLRYYILLGCLSGMFGLFIHAVTEFNFQIPANAYYFIFLLGLANSLQYQLSERQN